jgi:hypothetical protein
MTVGQRDVAVSYVRRGDKNIATTVEYIMPAKGGR